MSLFETPSKVPHNPAVRLHKCSLTSTCRKSLKVEITLYFYCTWEVCEFTLESHFKVAPKVGREITIRCPTWYALRSASFTGIGIDWLLFCVKYAFPTSTMHKFQHLVRFFFYFFSIFYHWLRVWMRYLQYKSSTSKRRRILIGTSLCLSPRSPSMCPLCPSAECRRNYCQNWAPKSKN